MRSAADLERARADDLLALEMDRAGIGRKLAGDEMKHRGFAGAVRPDQAGDAAGRDIEGEVAHGDEAAERFSKTMDAQHRAGRRAAGACDELRPGSRDAPHDRIEPRPLLRSSLARRRAGRRRQRYCRRPTTDAPAGAARSSGKAARAAGRRRPE